MVLDLAMLATDMVSPMAVTVLAMVDMPSGRGRLRLSPALVMVLVLAMAAMVSPMAVTVLAMVATDMPSGRGTLRPATAMVATAAMVDTATVAARGPLRRRPSPRPIP